MRQLRLKREERGLSQRDLARRAGVAYKTLQLLESGGHDPRWSTLAKIVGVLSPGRPGLEAELARLLGGGEDSVAGISRAILEEGESSWELRLFEFVDAFRRKPDPRRVLQAPDPGSSHRLQALLASTVESLCAQTRVPVPWWCAGVPPLPEPWFVSGVENLKASALVEAPAQFRRRNIFVLANFLDRA